jgi:hypothetical protein
MRRLPHSRGLARSLVLFEPGRCWTVATSATSNAVVASGLAGSPEVALELLEVVAVPVEQLLRFGKHCE